MKKKIAVIFGTRPEAIKCAPVVMALQKESALEPLVIVTAQHRQMLDQALEIFGIRPHVDLNVMKDNQTLAGLTASVVESMDRALTEHKPDFVLVQGDTTTTFASALAAFYRKIPVGHIEAGLRTYNKLNPFPEEVNRQLTSTLSELHFPPTELALGNLVNEGIGRDRILVTGNTVIDALLHTAETVRSAPPVVNVGGGRRLILVTAHRRENFGKPIEEICRAIKTLVTERDDIEVAYPVHLNPNIKGPVHALLGGLERVHLIPVQSYTSFVKLMSSAFFIMSDSGGVQEEAPSLGKPVLVLRETSERMEAVEAGTVRLVGTDPETIVSEALSLLDDREHYERMSTVRNPFGDGRASERIAAAVMEHFGFGPRPIEFSAALSAVGE